jgi:predicted dehydrogenase
MENNPTRKVVCGVIGAGWWGTYAHVPALLAHPRASLVAIQTRDRDSAAKIARDFNIPRTFTSADELIAQQDMEAVVISSAPHLHFPQAIAALRRGLHVLVEKPMTFAAAEARQLVEVAREQNLHLVSCFPWHHTRHGQEARRLIGQGELGDLRMISVLMTNPVDHLIRGAATFSTHGRPYIEPQEGTYSDPAVAGGGQIYAQVAHVAGYLTFLTGARPAQVFARFHNDGAQLDIFDVLNVELENGCIASIASTGATPLENRLYEVRIYGTKACLFMELWSGTLTVMRRDGGGETRYDDLAPNEIFPERAPAQNLVDAVLGVAEEVSPGTLGLASMEVIDAACQSARTGQNISIREPHR